MNVLLDTHALLWLVSEPSRVDVGALPVLSDSETVLWVSAASAWEVAVKTRLGRLDGEILLSTWGDVAIAPTLKV